MNNRIKYIYMLMIICSIVGCDQFKQISDISKVANITAKVKVEFADATGEIPPPNSYRVKFNNYTDRYEVIKQTDANGNVDVTDIIPGIYTINVSSEMSHNGFTYNFNGNLANIKILDNNKEFAIPVAASKSGNIVFKEIFYSGSKTPSKGSYFRDQYYELYNNSNTVQYVDKLCIGNLNPSTATDNLPSWPGEDANKFIYFLTIWQIPGNGTDYPLQPGESIIIAQMADNHQRKELNPTSPVNLLSAEFETYRASTSLIKDNPAINMKMAFWPAPTPQWLVTVFGGAYAIFYPDKEINPNDYVTPIGRTDKSYKVAIDLIVDAVELVHDESKMKLKRIPALLDAGATTVNGTYNTTSVVRKVKEVLPDGRVILMDSNNSSEDFEIAVPPTIRRHNAKVPSWNTWAN